MRSAMVVKRSIRRARADESTEILELWKHADATPSLTDNAEEIARAIGDPGAIFLVATEGDQIAGSIIAGWDGWRGNIYRLAVAPEYRRRRLAMSLTSAAIDALRERGARRITALVEHAHPDAVAF